MLSGFPLLDAHVLAACIFRFSMHMCLHSRFVQLHCPLHPVVVMENRRHKRYRAMAQDPGPDLQALQKLVHLGHITNSALAMLVRQINSNPDILGKASRARIAEANLASFFGVRHVHTLQLADNPTPFEWEMCDPNRLVSHLVHTCPRLAEAFAQAANIHPCSEAQPWHLVVGFDEFTPGNLLQPNNERKTMALNFSFLELGRERLWHDESWFTPILVRHRIVAKTVGGWSAMLRVYLHLHLFGKTGLATAGLPLELNGQPFLLFAKLSHFLADGDGIRQAYEWKGASGLKPCLRHWNVLKLNSDLAHRDNDFVEIDCVDPDLFQLTSPSDLFDMVDTILAMRLRVASGDTPKVRLEKLQMACGFSCSAEGLLADPYLRTHVDLLNVVTYDWMHSALQDGTLTTDAGLLLSSCEVVGITSKEIETHLKSDWVFPHAHRSKGKLLWRIFDQRGKSIQDKVKASASEMLVLYALLRHFFEVRLRDQPEVADQLRSFQAACLCVDILLRAKRGKLPMAEASALLKDAMRQHLLLHMHAYGKSHLKPKHHWMWDVAEQLSRDAFVLDCFVIERLHKRAKAMANSILNTQRFERSVLSSVLNDHRNALQAQGSPILGLTGKTAPLPGCPSALVGNRLVHEGLYISVGDIVFHENSMGSVSACCLEAGCLYVIVEEMIFVRPLSSHSGIWRRPRDQAQLKVWLAASLDIALAWTNNDRDTVTVIRL
jgi:hypothetical protein